MPDASDSGSEVEPQSAPAINVSGDATVDANQVTITGDIAGPKKITAIGYPVEQVIILAQISTALHSSSLAQCLDTPFEDNADCFNGREKSVSEFLARVFGAREVMIAGSSDGGKASTCRQTVIRG